MEKINVAELLKDCPKGMELNCTMFDGVKFDRIDAESFYPIRVKIGGDRYYLLTEYGQWNNSDDAKCVIFPKGKTTWGGFVSPCMFEDGDIVATNSGQWIGITTGGITNECIPTYCILKSDGKFEAYLGTKGKWGFERLATEEEKQELFQAIKDNGYKWNEETKTLEKEEKKDKFDIATLKPFDKVLVRDDDYHFWLAAIFSHYTKGAEDNYPYFASGSCFEKCIPFEGNQHLLGTTNDCDDFYKTWE